MLTMGNPGMQIMATGLGRLKQVGRPWKISQFKFRQLGHAGLGKYVEDIVVFEFDAVSNLLDKSDEESW